MKFFQRWAVGLSFVALPTFATAGEISDGTLIIAADLPEEVRSGESFEYELRMTNNSDNLTLHDVKVRQRPGDGFTIETARKESREQQNRQSGEQKQNGDSDDNRGQSDREASQDADGNTTFTIKKLEPGESQTVAVKATADGEGQLRTCLEIVDYRPAVCLTTRAVKPELAITKTAPKRANRCDLIRLEYTVRNEGSGDVGAFKVTDSLGENIKTIEGNDRLEFTVDGLAAGEERKFLGRVFATSTGTFGSRAEAVAESSDLKAQSKETETRVVAADLAVNVEGPQSLLNGELARFTATVTNNGNAAVENVDVRVNYPAEGDLVNVGDVTLTSNGGTGESKSEGQNPTVAEGGSSASTGDDGDNKTDESSNVAMTDEAMQIDRLEPGQSARFEYAIEPNGLDEVPTKVVAYFMCTIDEAVGEAETARDKVQAAAMARSRVVRLPALQLVAVDSQDPVPEGEETVYTVRVLNEGNAPDSNLQLKAELPKGMSFVNAEGPTDTENTGQTVTFKSLDELDAGDRVEYRITAKSDGGRDGNVTFKVEVKSDNRQKAIGEEEPTTLFSRN